MPAYVALLRAVNVGGTGKLPMAELKAMCEAAGCLDVRTYIASGNVVFQSAASAATVKTALEAALQASVGRPVGVIVRRAAEMSEIVAANPFPAAPPAQVLVLFLDDPPDADAIASATGRVDETIALGAREIYVHYAHGIGRSKLKIPAAKAGTGRNLNTVGTLADMVSALEDR